MRYLYVAFLVAAFVGGGVLGYRLSPRSGTREVPVEKMVTRTVTKEVVRGQGDKQVVERTITKTQDRAKVSPQSAKPQYRIGALLPLQSELRLQRATVSAGRRLVGDVWVDAQFNIGTQEVLLGVSVEF